jgi:hypothetical protein
MDHAQKVEIGTELAKGAPVMGVGGAVYIGGISLPDWAAIMAIIYTGCLLLMMGYKFVVWVNDRVRKRRAR